MEQPSVSFTASISVDYLSQSHKWSSDDAISSYKEICKQLNACQEKLREESEKNLNNRRIRKSSSHSKIRAAQVPSQLQQSQRGRNNNNNLNNNNNNNVIGNISKQLKQQRDESALRAEEKRLIRMKNALWRHMGQAVGCVSKGNKPVSPKTLKWQKDSDILWLYGPLYQPDNDPFMEDDDDKTLVGTPPATGCPPSPSLSPYSTSPTIKPALKKPVEHDPLKDLVSYACEVLANGKPKRRHTVIPTIEPKQKKKSIRFSNNLEQVHYTPTHYTIRTSPSLPPTRRRVSNPFFSKDDLNNHYGGKNIKNNEQYDQIFAWAKEQVKSTGKLRLFGEDGTWLENESDDDEFVMPPPLVKSIPSRRSPSSSPRSPNRRSSAAPPTAYTATATKKGYSAYSKNSFVDQKQHVTSHVFNGDSEAESGVVERCVNIASNVKDVVSWCGSMLWNTTVF